LIYFVFGKCGPHEGEHYWRTASSVFNADLTKENICELYLNGMMGGLESDTMMFSEVFDKFKELKRYIEKGQTLAQNGTSLVKIMTDLLSTEATLRQHKCMQGSTRSDNNKRDNRTQARPSERQPSAHLVQRKEETQLISAKFQKPKCIGCGTSGHKLKDCRRTPEDQKKKLYEEMNRNCNAGKRNVKFASGTKPGREKGKPLTEDKSPDDTKMRPEPKPSYTDKAKANSAINVSRGPSFAGMVKV
jgi:hypothetical protein